MPTSCLTKIKSSLKLFKECWRCHVQRIRINRKFVPDSFAQTDLYKEQTKCKLKGIENESEFCEFCEFGNKRGRGGEGLKEKKERVMVSAEMETHDRQRDGN